MVLALDGSAQKSYSGTTIVFSGLAILTTSIDNDIIIVTVGARTTSAPYVTVSSISSTPTLTWTLRRQKQQTNSSTVWQDLEEWYTVWTSHGELSITVTLSGTPSYGKGVAFGISGANTATIFDSNAGANPTGSGNSADPTVSITTSNANDFIFGLETTTNANIATPGSGFTNIQQIENLGTEYKIVSATQSGATVNFIVATGLWCMIADAIMQATAAVSLRRLKMGLGR